MARATTGVKAAKWIGIGIAVYACLVAGFESLLGYFQPSSDRTMVITTLEEDGTPKDRVVSRLESEGKLYVAANHWPRAWYRRARENSEVQVTIDGDKADYAAVVVSAEEYERVDGAHPLSLGFRILTGFPPRRILRLDPR